VIDKGDQSSSSKFAIKENSWMVSVDEREREREREKSSLLKASYPN